MARGSTTHKPKQIFSPKPSKGSLTRPQILPLPRNLQRAQTPQQQRKQTLSCSVPDGLVESLIHSTLTKPPARTTSQDVYSNTALPLSLYPSLCLPDLSSFHTRGQPTGNFTGSLHFTKKMQHMTQATTAGSISQQLCQKQSNASSQFLCLLSLNTQILIATLSGLFENSAVYKTSLLSSPTLGSLLSNNKKRWPFFCPT